MHPTVTALLLLSPLVFMISWIT